VLFGAYSVSGRLPVTMYKESYLEQIEASDMSMTTFPGRTYRYCRVEPLLPFGYGLSYTNISYSSLTIVPESAPVSSPRTVTVVLTNIGQRESDEVVLVFAASHSVPPLQFGIKKLIAFDRIHDISVADKRVVVFELSPDVFSYVNDNADRVISPGKYTLTVGNIAGQLELL